MSRPLVGAYGEFYNLYYTKLGMCGCGNPEDVKNYIYKVLKVQKDWKNGTITFDQRVRIHKKIIKETDPDIILQFTLHVLDNSEFLEHGGSIGGAWFTENGDRLLELLEKFKDVDE